MDPVAVLQPLTNEHRRGAEISAALTYVCEMLKREIPLGCRVELGQPFPAGGRLVKEDSELYYRARYWWREALSHWSHLFRDGFPTLQLRLDDGGVLLVEHRWQFEVRI